MIDPAYLLDLIYLAIGVVIGVSSTMLFLARDPAPAPAPKRPRIEPEQKVAPLHVIERIGTNTVAVSMKSREIRERVGTETGCCMGCMRRPSACICNGKRS